MIRTKIIATVGPGTSTAEVVGRLICAGVDVFRLNFSHTTQEEQTGHLERIRACARERGATVAVLGDLCGPKIRVNPVEDDGVAIAAGERIEIVPEPVIGNRERISTNRPELVGELREGHRVFIEDGLIRLRVDAISASRIRCLCEVGGVIRTRKGMNFPDTDLAMSALTDKDRQDVAWAVANDVDYLALSFVRRPEDIEELRTLLRASGHECPIVAKVETPQAIERIDGIVAAADALLVARGDLGVEMDLARLPLLQKTITAKCQKAGKPVIVATEMLQSMVEHPTATRAEVTDVANAIFDAADCVMLSAETSVGKYPIESVRMMNRIAEQTEAYLAASGAFARMDADPALNPATSAVTHGACLLGRELNARLLVAWTDAGRTVRLLSKCRPDRPVVGLCPDERVCRRMMLYYGVTPLRVPRPDNLDAMLQTVDRALQERGLASPGDLIVLLAGTRLEPSRATNALLIHRVGEMS